MCARFTLTQTTQSISDYFGGLLFPTSFPKIRPRYNIAPTQPVLCLRRDADDRAMRPIFLRWGLVPPWAENISFGSRTINARGETVAAKPAFRNAFRNRRCIVLADGFYEWKTESRRKLPFHITGASKDVANSNSVLSLAGLWESWSDPADPNSPPIETCTIITTEANALMRDLHDRMPVFLNREESEVWLDPESRSTAELQSLLKPCDSELLQMAAANPWLNKVDHEGPRCLEPPETPDQPMLF